MSVAHGAAAPAVPPSGRSYWPMVPAVAALTVIVTAVNFLAPLLLLLSNDLGVTVPEVGQLVVFTALSWAATALFTGLISDRYGRRPVVITALTGMGVCTILGAFATEFWMLIALRLVTGIFGSGGPPTIMAGLVDYYPPHQRGKAIGWVNTTFSTGALIGVPLAGWAGGQWGWRVAFVLVGVALILAALTIAAFFPRVRAGGSGAGNPLQAYGHLVRLPHMATFLSANFFERVTFMVMSLYYAAFLIQTYFLDAKSVAPLLSLTAAGALIGALSGGYLADHFNRVLLAGLMLAGSAVFGLATFYWPGALALSVAAGMGFGFTNAASRPPFMSLLLGLSDLHRGALNGLVSTSNQVGWAVGAGLGGLVLGLFGYGGLGLLILGLGLTSALLIALTRSVQKRPAPRPTATTTAPPAGRVPAGAMQTAESVAATHGPPATPDWARAALAAEAGAADFFGRWAARTPDPLLAETLDVAAARARDRAFRLRRSEPAGSNGHHPEPTAPGEAGEGDWPPLPAGPGAPARDLALLEGVLARPALYAEWAAAEAGTNGGGLLPLLRENEAETRALLTEQRDRLRRAVGPDSVRVLPVGAPERVAGNGVLRQIIRNGGDAPALTRISQPPGSALQVRPLAAVALLPISGDGHCRPAGGDEAALRTGRLFELAGTAPTEVVADGDRPLTYLLLGDADLTLVPAGAGIA